jgi:hypothetical protein
MPMLIRIVKGDALANVVLAADKFTAPNPGGPSRVMRLQGQFGISDPIGDLDQFAEVPQALLILPTATVGGNPQSPGRGEARAIVAEPGRQLGGAAVSAPGFGGAVPAGRQQHRAERQLQRQLLLEALRRLRQLAQSRNAAREMRGCFDIGRVPRRTTPGLQPKGGGAVEFARFGQVVGENFGRPFDDFWRLFLYCFGNPRVQRPARAAQ